MGTRYSLAVSTDGKLYAWGRNIDGQLGDGTNTSTNSHVRIGAATNWKNIAAGAVSHNLAINTDGELYAWGYNGQGQLGDGTDTNKNTPTRIGTATNWKNIAAGSYHSMAINAAGELYAWGSNHYGQLGNGTKLYETTPILVKILP